VKQQKYLVDELKEKPRVRAVQTFKRSNIPLTVEVTITDASAFQQGDSNNRCTINFLEMHH